MINERAKDPAMNSDVSLNQALDEIRRERQGRLVAAFATALNEAGAAMDDVSQAVEGYRVALDRMRPPLRPELVAYLEHNTHMALLSLTDRDAEVDDHEEESYWLWPRLNQVERDYVNQRGKLPLAEQVRDTVAWFTDELMRREDHQPGS